MAGLRIGELLALRWQDVDLQNGFLSVRQTVYEGHFDEPKTKHSKRTVPLPPECVEIFARLRPGAAQPSALVFSTATGSPLCRRICSIAFKPVCKSLGWTVVTCPA
jgi:integrase